MKIDIQHTRRNLGIRAFFLQSLPAIILTVVFAPQELAIIKKKQLNHLSFHRPPSFKYEAFSPEQREILIGDLIRSPVCIFYDTIAELEIDDQKLRQSLKELKDGILAFSPERPTGSYEL